MNICSYIGNQNWQQMSVKDGESQTAHSVESDTYSLKSLKKIWLNKQNFKVSHVNQIILISSLNIQTYSRQISSDSKWTIQSQFLFMLKVKKYIFLQLIILHFSWSSKSMHPNVFLHYYSTPHCNFHCLLY